MRLFRPLVGVAACGLVLSGVSVLGLPGTALAGSDPARLAGNDRIGTAIAVKKSFTQWSDTAILARADDFADSLGGGALSGALRAPLFLTGSGSVDTRVLANLREGGFRKVVLLGGRAALGAGLESDLRSAAYEVERLAGANRYETSAMIARRVLATTGKSEVFLASGQVFADALSATAAAAHRGGAVLLTADGVLSPAAKGFLSALGQKGVRPVVNAVGGPAVLAAQNGGVVLAQVLRGSNRYATAARVAEVFFPGAKTVVLASGQTFADALAAGGVAGLTGRPLLLTTAAGLPAATSDYLNRAGIALGGVTVVGGSKAAAVSPEKPAGPQVKKPANPAGGTTPGSSAGTGSTGGGAAGGSAPGTGGGNPGSGGSGAPADPNSGRMQIVWDTEGNSKSNPFILDNEDNNKIGGTVSVQNAKKPVTSYKISDATFAGAALSGIRDSKLEIQTGNAQGTIFLKIPKNSAPAVNTTQALKFNIIAFHNNEELGYQTFTYYVKVGEALTPVVFSVSGRSERKCTVEYSKTREGINRPCLLAGPQDVTHYQVDVKSENARGNSFNSSKDRDDANLWLYDNSISAITFSVTNDGKITIKGSSTLKNNVDSGNKITVHVDAKAFKNNELVGRGENLEIEIDVKD